MPGALTSIADDREVLEEHWREYSTYKAQDCFRMEEKYIRKVKLASPSRM